MLQLDTMPRILTWCRRRRLYHKLGIKSIQKTSCRPLLTSAFRLSSDSLTHEQSKGKKLHSGKGKVLERVLHPTLQHLIGQSRSKRHEVFSEDFPQQYDPKYVEGKWYDWWLAQEFFKPSLNANDKKEIFSMVLPPPNVTGTLHLGHALTNSIQDALVRWNRMHGKCVVWVPGSDHAGIATQVVVEKQLWKDKKLTRHDIGREKFIEEVWKWKNQKGNIISDQMKKIGSSLDWSRECFTMDQKLSDAVNEAFIRLHDEGLIYRHDRLVNWSCSLQSAISNIEVDNVEIEGKRKINVPGYEKPVNFGVMTHFKYPVENSDESVAIATTRPETMLGDVAIAVNPCDTRYHHLHNHYIIHPIDNRRLPIITDQFVDKDFGTGAVKITPGHDYNDYNLAQRHDLPALTVIDNNGRMINTTDEFNQKRRFDVRWMVVKKLKALGLFIEEKSHTMTLPMCSRSKDIIEPLVKEQWYINCDDMSKKAIESIQNGELKIIPSNYEKYLINWFQKTEDWCISRQLWWGHQIPAYRVTSPTQSSELWVSGRSEIEAKLKAANRLGISVDSVEIQRDEDVLDTWFSSALFPFSVHGWPSQTEDLSKYYPNSLLETGHDILYMWVARMVILGQKLTGQFPFSQVLLHGILKDASGRKMSKSLGNVIDPMDVIQGVSLQELIEKLKDSNLDLKEIKKAEEGIKKEFPAGIPECGADALRFTLCSYDFKDGEVNVDRTLFKSNRHFCNKIWQGFRFTLSNLGDDFTPSSNFQISEDDSIINKWIVSQLSNLVLSCDKNFKSYDLHQAAISLHQFWISQFCDVYLECIKPVFLHGSTEQKQKLRETLYFCVETFLRCLSPFMPFITEELYQRLPNRGDKCVSICVAPYPTVSQYNYRNKDIENRMVDVQSVISNILRIKSDYRLKIGKPVYIKIAKDQDWWNEYKAIIKTLSRSESITMVTDKSPIPDNCSYSYIRRELEIFYHLQNLYDRNVEMSRLKKLSDKIQSKIKQIDDTLITDSNNQQLKQKRQSLLEELEKSKQFLEES